MEDEPGRSQGPAGNRFGARALGFEFSVFRGGRPGNPDSGEVACLLP
jgi:hypothetical protein